MSRVIPNYSTESLEIVLVLSLLRVNSFSAIRQRLTDKTNFHNYRDTHADNAIPKNFIYKEVFRP